ncbi:MAG: hypothetical protein PHE89_06215 [Alphaproteobacteria bacterium]|nr:hypothetical protein [Alphaproteobacteria bacterium]
MFNKFYKILPSFIFACCFLATNNVMSAETCEIAPTCDSLGYTQTTSECTGNFLKCPFDQTKVFCMDCNDPELGNPERVWKTGKYTIDTTVTKSFYSSFYGYDVTVYKIVPTTEFKKAYKKYYGTEPGDGGYIQQASNLSQTGYAWIYNGGQADEASSVYENAQIYGSGARAAMQAKARGTAIITGSAIIAGTTQFCSGTYSSGTYYGSNKYGC